MQIVSFKRNSLPMTLILPCEDELLSQSSIDMSIMGEELVDDAVAVIIYVPPYYDLDKLLIQLNEIAKKHQPRKE